MEVVPPAIQDTDSDGLADDVETNTAIFISAVDTGTNSNNADSDGDGVPDGLEVKEKTSPVDATKFNAFSKGIVAYLPFDNSHKDLSGFNRSITPLSNPTYITETDGRLAVQFDGVDDAFLFTNDSDMPLFRSDWENPPASLNQGPLSVSIWIRRYPGGALNQCVFGKRDYTSFNLVLRNGKFTGEARWPGVQPDPLVVSNSNEVPDENWHHVTYVWNQPNFRIYIDGVIDSEVSAPNITQLASVSMPWVIGAKSDLSPASVEFFRGAIDNLRLYGRALSGTEISSLYALERPPSELIHVSVTLPVNGNILGAGNYLTGTSATLAARPNPGYVFTGWTGDATGLINPLEILMDADKTIGATFSPDLTDGDSDGLSNHDEVVVYGTNPALADTDGDGLDDQVEIVTHDTNPSARDTDADGFDDRVEIDSGYDPKLASSTPEAQTSIRTAVEFRFNAASGVSYRIEDSTDLQDWNTIEAAVIGQGNVVTRFYSTENHPKRCFRVKRN